MINSNTLLLTELLQQAPILPDLKDCLDRNEQGDAELFASLFSEKVVFDPVEKQWYLWHKHFWEADKSRQVLQLITNQVAARYQDRASEEHQ